LIYIKIRNNAINRAGNSCSNDAPGLQAAVPYAADVERY
jgi:hypothetical protein